MYQVKCTSYPNGETRLVLSALGGGRAKESSVSTSAPLSAPEIEGGETTLPSNLTLALKSNPENEILQRRRRMGHFTLDARRKLLRAGGALARYDSIPSHCVFLTGTLPASTFESYKVMATYSAQIVNRVKSWIHKRYSAHNLSFYCWEMQKRGALHLHYLVYCPSFHARKNIIETFKKFWIGLLMSISEKSGVDMFERADGGTHRHNLDVVQAYAQECYKSVAAYMAKYVGKQAGKGDTSNFPSTWSAVSRPLGKLIHEYTEECRIESPSYAPARALYVRCSEELSDTSAVCYDYKHKVGVGDTHLAYYKENEDLQSCHHNRVSLMMNSKNLSRSQHQDWRVAPMVSLCITLAVREFLEFCPNSSDTSTDSSVYLRGILTESLRESFGENLPLESMSNLESLVMGQLEWSLAVATNMSTTSTQLSFQVVIAQSLGRMQDPVNLRLTRKVVGRFLCLWRQKLDSQESRGYRGTTLPTIDGAESGTSDLGRISEQYTPPLNCVQGSFF